jgi:prepilin-type N-terminal cleavage/methylation domain-containing protein
MKKGFTVLELLIVIAIIGILASVIIPSVNSARGKATKSRATGEMKSMATALELYKSDHSGDYPPDASRNIPPGIEPYLAENDLDNWPDAPWPGSVYDWENWADPDFPGERIYQISIRFCPAGGTIDTCTFPDEPWAVGFDTQSSFYYCVAGRCRSHVSSPYNHPGYCANCAIQPSDL